MSEFASHVPRGEQSRNRDASLRIPRAHRQDRSIPSRQGSTCRVLSRMQVLDVYQLQIPLQRVQLACRVGDKLSCEDGSGIECYARLWELPSSCGRMSNAIRVLQLKPHALGCPKTRRNLPISLLLQISDALPHLRKAKLPDAFGVVLCSEPSTDLSCMSARTCSLEKLQVEVTNRASADAALDLQSAFYQITRRTRPQCREISGLSSKSDPRNTVAHHPWTLRCARFRYTARLRKSQHSAQSPSFHCSDVPH